MDVAERGDSASARTIGRPRTYRTSITRARGTVPHRSALRWSYEEQRTRPKPGPSHAREGNPAKRRRGMAYGAAAGRRRGPSGNLRSAVVSIATLGGTWRDRFGAADQAAPRRNDQPFQAVAFGTTLRASLSFVPAGTESPVMPGLSLRISAGVVWKRAQRSFMLSPLVT